MARVVILGAGLTGLSAAYHLEQQNFFEFKIFEKENSHGGLVRSIKHEGFTFDFTGHFLHTNNDYFSSFLNRVLPKKTRNEIERHSFVFTHNRFIPYPIQMNLHHLPPYAMIESLVGFSKRKHNIKNPKNFHEWVLKYFGTGLAKHFFFPYNTKLLQYDVKKIHHSWTGRFVPKTTIYDIMEHVTSSTASSNVGYNHHFLYPKKGGIQSFVDGLQQQIASPINTNHNAVEIDLTTKQVIFENGHIEPFEHLITTLPLPNLLRIIRQPSNVALKHLRKKLLYTSVVNFNLGYKAENDPNRSWFYLPEKKYHTYRIGFWHTFSKNLAPKNCHALYGELAYRNTDSERKRKKETLTHQAIQQTSSLLNITKNQLITQKILHIPYAYVIYDDWRENNITMVHEALNKQEIFSVGRYGEWKYSSMQEAILDGRQIATKILEETLQHNFIPATRDHEKELLITKIKQIQVEGKNARAD